MNGTGKFVPHFSLFFGVLIIVLSPCSTKHWMCSFIDCSTDVIIYESSLYDGCVVGSQIITIEADVMRCFSFCLVKKCVLVASNGNRCVIAGVGDSPLNTTAVVFQQTSSIESPITNKALNKPITCSSVFESTKGYDLECYNANDGLLESDTNFYCSKLFDKNPWLVIDLGDVYSVQKLEFLTRTNFPSTHKRTSDINFYLGSVEVLDGEFSANGYQQIWYYEGPYGDPATGGTDWLKYTLPIPKCGRYFAMDKGNAFDEKLFLEVAEIRVLAVAV